MSENSNPKKKTKNPNQKSKDNAPSEQKVTKPAENPKNTKKQNPKEGNNNNTRQENPKDNNKQQKPENANEKPQSNNNNNSNNNRNNNNSKSLNPNANTYTGLKDHADIINVNLKVDPNENELETGWTFWYEKRVKDPNQNWEESLKKIGSFNTAQGFWRLYTHIKRPSQLEKDENIYCFRGLNKPMWETWPYGGVWLRKLKRSEDSGWLLDKRWELLLLAAIGEAFENPDVVGVAISCRAKEDYVALWNRDQKHPKRFKLGSKLKEVLQLEQSAPLEYKDHQTSMKDNSTYRNSVPYKLE